MPTQFHSDNGNNFVAAEAKSKRLLAATSAFTHKVAAEIDRDHVEKHQLQQRAKRLEPNHTFGPGNVFVYLDESMLPGNGFQNKLRFEAGNTKASLDSKVETSLDTLSLKPQHLPSYKKGPQGGSNQQR